jgi:hypothetical protein
MLNQWPTLNITCSNQYQVQTYVDICTSHFSQLTKDNIAEHYDLHCLEFDAETFVFIHSGLADSKYHLHVAKRVDGGVYTQYPMLGVSIAVNEWAASSFVAGGSTPGVYLCEIFSLGKVLWLIC